MIKLLEIEHYISLGSVIEHFNGPNADYLTDMWIFTIVLGDTSKDIDELIISEFDNLKINKDMLDYITST
jgi:hypothetical protein